jgi:hypothetical protein
MNNNFEDFERSAIAGIIGGYIGHKLDQTRFGIWFNQNRWIDLFYTEVAKMIIVVIAVMVLWFFYLLIL